MTKKARIPWTIHYADPTGEHHPVTHMDKDRAKEEVRNLLKEIVDRRPGVVSEKVLRHEAGKEFMSRALWVTCRISYLLSYSAYVWDAYRLWKEFETTWRPIVGDALILETLGILYVTPDPAEGEEDQEGAGCVYMGTAKARHPWLVQYAGFEGAHHSSKHLDEGRAKMEASEILLGIVQNIERTASNFAMVSKAGTDDFVREAYDTAQAIGIDLDVGRIWSAYRRFKDFEAKWASDKDIFPMPIEWSFGTMRVLPEPEPEA